MTKQEKTKADTFLDKILNGKALLIILAFLIVSIILFFFNEDINTALKINDSKFSAFGEFIGGTLGTLISLVTLILVYKTFLSQKQELEDQRNVFIHNQVQDMIYREIEFFNNRFKDLNPTTVITLSGRSFSKKLKEYSHGKIIYDTTNGFLDIKEGSSIGRLITNLETQKDLMDCKKYLESVMKSLNNSSLKNDEKEQYWIKYIDHLNTTLLHGIYDSIDLWNTINKQKADLIKDEEIRNIFNNKYDKAMIHFEVFLTYRPNN